MLNVFVGWPAVVLLAAGATLLGAEWLGLIGGVICYGLSWAMLGAAVLLGGPEAVVHGRALIRRWFEKRAG